jgi:hypothetical protein
MISAADVFRVFQTHRGNAIVIPPERLAATGGILPPTRSGT